MPEKKLMHQQSAGWQIKNLSFNVLSVFSVISCSLLLGACAGSAKNAKQDCEADLGCNKQLILVKAAEPVTEVSSVQALNAEGIESLEGIGDLKAGLLESDAAGLAANPATPLESVTASERLFAPASKSAASPIDEISRTGYTRLVAHFHKWQGVPYQYGGTSMKGVDCSAYVQKSIKYSFNVQLPRTTRLQIHKGKSVTRKELKPGDVVFFAMTPWELHNGVYLGNGFFVHASSSKGVTRSNLDQPYWKKRFKEGRRVNRL